MADEVNDTEVTTEENVTPETEKVSTESTEEVQIEKSHPIKVVVDKIESLTASIKEQSGKTATKKDVWKAALTNATIIIGSIVVSAVLGV